MVLVAQELPLMCLVLLLLCREPGVDAQAGQGFTLQQPQAKVTVAAGETLTLNCTTSGIAGPGPVKWLKGWGTGNKTVYDQQQWDPLFRVTRAVGESDTDFTIRIRNVQPEDMGTYYCVKFVKGDSGDNELFQRGSGTEVSVQGANPPSSLLLLLWMGVLLEKGLLGGLLLFLFQRMKRKASEMLLYPAPPQSPAAGSRGSATARSGL
ncbi:tyrosine-protein phosphatase non-receptor type substrate 1-like [Passer montanus]|uniref:tyrosine-protein phosphatase non-receptor type substrate 1-like n=1 Tax=Passer montanus TaxID=9160 RepID=UPI001960EF3E|nr:tyrosine-protein phosphatase non-receptor type substrate 1-like [Passer montanus]